MGDPDPFEYVRDWQASLDSSGWWHSFELPDGTRIDGVHPVEGLRLRIDQFPIPEDLHGKRVLDIGAWDGWYSFEMERRGAEVLAIDVWDNPRFHEMRSRLGSSVDYRLMDVYDLTPARVGTFDIVLFLAVLYHLKHPLLALERVCALTTDLAAVESFVLKEEHRPGADVASRPIMEFYETTELGGQTDNWVGPSLPCLLALCRTAGFARVELQSELSRGASVACYRRWGGGVDVQQPAPRLTSAFHHTSYGINFSSERDEYVNGWFEWAGGDLALSDVQPEVGGFGSRPIHISRRGGSEYEATFKLPPGLAPGWHPVQVRVRNGPPSRSVAIAVDVPLPDRPVAITAVADATTRIPGQLQLGSGHDLCLWVDGLPENADKGNLRVVLGSRRVPISSLEDPRSDREPRQVIAEVPAGVPEGRMNVQILLGRQKSNSVPVALLP